MRVAALTPPVRVTSPTTLDAGPGAAEATLAGVAPGAVAVLYDPAVEEVVERIVRGGRHHGLVCRPVDRAPTLDDLAAVGAWIAASAPTAVVAVGGGRVIDLAKLASTVGRAPASLRHLEGLARRAGYARLPPGATRRQPLLAVPTTLGTGAEVSAVAVVDGPGGDRTLVFSPRLRATTAVLDPQATATLPIRLVREGALEALLRVAGAEIGSASTLRMAATEARMLAQQLAAALDELCDAGKQADDELRLFVAQLSSATHRGWALSGRSAFPSPLWFLGTELAVVLGVTKMAATAMLLPAWLGRVAAGDDRWGDRDRLAAMWTALGVGPAGADVAAATHALLTRWRLEREPGDVPPDAVAVAAERVVRRWGGRLPMLGRFDTDEIAAVLDEALATGAGDLAVAGA